MQNIIHKVKFYKMKMAIKNVEAAHFLLPGLIGMPIGGLYGGYHIMNHFVMTENKHKCPGVNATHVSFGCVFGAVVGGILGTIWPISISAYILTNTLQYANTTDYPYKLSKK